MKTARHALLVFAITFGLALGLTSFGDAQGPVVLRNSSGVEIATNSNPIRTDPTGSTTQPVSGTVTANQGGTWTVQPGNTANTTAWKVDGSAVTQPVSGTVTANMGTVTADPFGANADAASATGSISAKLRFIASTGIPITGTVTVGSHNVTNAGTFAVQAAQSGTWTVQPGNTANTTPWLVRRNDTSNSEVIDPCEANTQSAGVISISTATTTRIVAPVSAKKAYICGLTLIAAGADNVALVEGTGGTCGTGTAGMSGGTTAATGWNFAANSGLVWQAGKTAHAVTAGTNVDVCLITSAAVQLSGTVKYVTQ